MRELDVLPSGQGELPPKKTGRAPRQTAVSFLLGTSCKGHSSAANGREQEQLER